MKRFIKVVSAIVIFVVILTLLGGFSYFYVITKNVTLSEENLGFKESSISIYNLNNELIDKTEYTDEYITLDKMPESLPNAFISIEDKRFYKHKGLDYIRIAGAMISNIKAGKLKEGASTITQQLIKNTHLTGEKSFNRKFQEAKLALELEKEYSKDQIIEMYLNAIYFGNGIYGVGEAAKRFFNKDIYSLTISESAMLAGIVKNPSKYSPVSNYNNSKERRDLILQYMLDQEMIDDTEYNNALNENISIYFDANITSKLKPYMKNALIQAANILGLSANDLSKNNYKIYTYIDLETQKSRAGKIYNSEYYKANSYNIIPDGMGLVLDNSSGGIIAYSSTSPYSAYEVFRQPGSALKPFSVYVPALEYNIITPGTQILDEATTFGEYTPRNYNDSYYGWVSAREAISESMNVSAVKILSYLGTERSLEYMNKFHFNIENEDSGLSLALGGTHNGVSILQMAAAYRTLSDYGNYQEISFIRQIVDENNNIIYSHNKDKSKIISDDNAYLITDMLMSTVQSGTASKLNSLNCQIASKTGTVATSDNNYNSDAWSMSYTTEHTVCIWQGNISNKSISMLDSGVTGGAYPTMLARDVYRELYRNSSPSDFIKPNGIIELQLDKFAKEKDHLLLLASEFTPDEYVYKEIFSEENQPSEISAYFNAPTVENFVVVVEENVPNIKFKAYGHIVYKIIRNSMFDSVLVTTVEGKDGEIVFIDNDAPENSILRYTIYPSITLSDGEIEGIPSNTSVVFTGITNIYNKEADKDNTGNALKTEIN